MGKKVEIPRRGRSLTIRHPEDSTNAACNIYSDNYTARTTKQSYDHSPQKMVENGNDPLSILAAIAFFDPLDLFGSTTMALIASFALLVIAIAISFLVEGLMDIEAVI
mmetsp:Transcript_22489/g.55752  ORF Transcript_22489/g.55752 Transcript_22489/m.55752 type:complete len:108 (+) Transcript_22489:124-447(+)